MRARKLTASIWEGDLGDGRGCARTRMEKWEKGRPHNPKFSWIEAKWVAVFHAPSPGRHSQLLCCKHQHHQNRVPTLHSSFRSEQSSDGGQTPTHRTRSGNYHCTDKTCAKKCPWVRQRSSNFGCQILEQDAYCYYLSINLTLRKFLAVFLFGMERKAPILSNRIPHFGTAQHWKKPPLCPRNPRGLWQARSAPAGCVACVWCGYSKWRNSLPSNFTPDQNVILLELATNDSNIRICFPPKRIFSIRTTWQKSFVCE